MPIARFEHCGRYELHEILGEGAMGTVYRGWDPALARAVAIKLIQGWELSEDTVERFRREAQALAKLPHPNIVGVYDVSMAGDDPFIVMELVEGRSLAAVINAGVPPIVDQLRLMIQVCDALACAHAAGIVHRDVKPGNIMVTTAGHAKLADFGVARLHDSTLTATANVVGTPAYLAPEAFSDGAIDERTDIYALTACLYELASGSRLHQGSDLASLVARVTQHDAPRLSSAWPDCPPALDRCVQKGLARRPEDRYQRAVDLADDLGAVLKELGASPTASAPDRTKRVTPPVPRSFWQENRPRAALAAALLLLALEFLPRGGAPVPPSDELMAGPTDSLGSGARALTSPGATSGTPAGRPSNAPTDSVANPPATSLSNRRIDSINDSGVHSVNKAGPAPRGPSTTRGAVRQPPASASSAPAPAPVDEDDEEEPARRAVPIGTRLHVSLVTELRTDRSQPGHQFEGRLAQAVALGGEVIAPAGAVVRGIVDEVHAGAGARAPSLRLSLSELTLNGAPARIRTARYEVVSPTDAGGAMGTLVLGSVAGAVAGGLTAGSRGAVTGGALGAAAASSGREAPRPGDIVLSNPLIFRLAEPLLLASKPD